MREKKDRVGSTTKNKEKKKEAPFDKNPKPVPPVGKGFQSTSESLIRETQEEVSQMKTKFTRKGRGGVTV